MAWEQRGNRTYYYRSVRVGRQVVKEYAGGGLMGSLGADFDADQRERRQRERTRSKRERTQWADLERQAGELDKLSDLLLSVSLLDAGFHRHDRGEWRRRRG